MQVHHGAGLGARGHHRIPVAGVDARQSEHRRVLAERDGVEATLGVLADHLRAEFGVQQPGQLARNDPAGIRPGPHVEVPVVPGAHRGQRQVAILGHLLQSLAGEARQERGKVQRRVDAVEVHVLDALVDIPGAPAHFVEADRFEAVLRHRPTDDGVEADIRQLLIVVDPGLAAVVGVDDFRRAVGEPLRQTAGERVRRFDDVIVDRDQRVAARRPGRIGQKRDRAVLAGLGGGEVQVGGQFVDRFHRNSAQLSTVGIGFDGHPGRARPVHVGGSFDQRSSACRPCPTSSSAQAPCR